MREAGDLLSIRLLDHLILGDDFVADRAKQRFAVVEVLAVLSSPSAPSGLQHTRSHTFLSFLQPPTFSVWSKMLNPLISATRENCAEQSVGSLDRMCKA
ncbi:MAG: hypothetical protein H8K07_18465 [Nitrospira sp.]|nr:hypothetical protein [Nitrospira sp.]